MRMGTRAWAGLLAATLGACGGGGGSGSANPGTGGSTAPPVASTPLSPDQQTFESVNTQGGQFTLLWKFPFGGGNLVSGTDYLMAISHGLLPQSPSLGAQIQTERSTSLDPALAGRTAAPMRYLSGGSVWIVPVNAVRRVSYVGDAVRVDYLASDGSTVLASEQWSQYAVVPLSGPMGNSPEELLANVPLQDWVGANNFSATASWQSGSAYIKQKGVRVGDLVIVQDCPNDTTPVVTAGSQPSPCASGSTLEQALPMTLPGQSLHPAEFEQLADGTISRVAGVRMWVANATLPPAESGTPLRRVYYELNGNVYAGLLEKDGAPFRYRQYDGSEVDYALSLNQAAVSSIGAGVITGAAAGLQAGSSAQVGGTVDLFGVGGHGINGSLAPADLREHYDIPAGLDGGGQTIAVVEAPTLHGDVQADLNVFSQVYGLPPCNTSNPCFRHVDLSNGVVAPDDSWTIEAELDAQMIHAVAPAATIVMVTAASSSSSDLSAAASHAAAIPGVTAVSMSYSGQASSTDAASQDALYAAAQSNGLVLLACTGDDGYVGSVARYPAASPYVTSVGGTSISAVAGGQNESAWVFSSGGANPFAAMPAWQSAVLGTTGFNANGGQRAMPDVAAVADAQRSAFAIYREQQWVMVGGTSVSTPFWAGVTALLGQKLAQEGTSLAALVRATPGGFNGLLYQPRLSQGNAPAVVALLSGSNDLAGDCSLCDALGDYNDATGLGRPDVASLLAAF